MNDHHLTRLRRYLTILAVLLFIAACQQPGDSDMTESSESDITELMITDLSTGNGATAAAGQTVSVHYTGLLYDPSQPDNKGTQFDSSDLSLWVSAWDWSSLAKAESSDLSFRFSD